MQAHRGSSLPKFGEWDEKDPAAAEGFTVIFDRARDTKKNGGTPNNVIPQENQNQNQNQYRSKNHEAAKKNHKQKYPRKEVCYVINF